jgi:hypothetical protein
VTHVVDAKDKTHYLYNRWRMLRPRNTTCFATPLAGSRLRHVAA